MDEWDWSAGVDTPRTVMTTSAPAVLTNEKISFIIAFSNTTLTLLTYARKRLPYYMIGFWQKKTSFKIWEYQNIP